jgi:ankyrin repeat protein
LQRPFELICSEGSLSQPETHQHQAASTEMLQATCEALWSVSAAKAQSSVASDKYQIWAEVADTRFKGRIDGFGASKFFQAVIDQRGTDVLGAMFFAKFDRYMTSLLSTTLLQVLLSRGEYRSAAKCCLYGAQVDSAQVEEISNSFTQESERTAWLSILLIRKASRSDESMAKLLLDLGADVRAARQDGATALLIAAACGYLHVSKLLLENGADVQAAMEDGAAALTLAAQSGHVDVTKLLLENGADARAATQDGATALMIAAESGHMDVTKLLLEKGADVRATRQDGATALMIAAENGHVNVSKLLLENGADARAARQNGTTALMVAAENGHVNVAKLLLQNGADAKAATPDGDTALMVARENGHEAVARLLHEHG